MGVHGSEELLGSEDQAGVQYPGGLFHDKIPHGVVFIHEAQQGVFVDGIHCGGFTAYGRHESSGFI